MTPELRWLSDPTVFAVNRLDAHSDHLCCRTLDEAESGLTSLRQSLDGAWRFAWSANPAARPADFWQPDADLSGFGTICVPGHIELQGYGQLQYTNTLYPWDGRSCLRPPQVDWNDDPVGSYVKEFDLDESLRGQRVCVSFQGVEQAMYLWCNGQFVGYAEDSFTPSEFELTPYIRDENNRLCVEVYKRCSAAWIEDQDFFRFSGIFRSVYLYAKPKVHINDIWLKADLAADNTTGLLTPLVKLDGETDGASVALVVTDPEGYAVYEGPATGDTIEIEGIQPWSHAAPVLYHAVLTLRDADGVLQEVVPYDIGFRRFEMINGVMCLNGERVVFNGVNRHEWNADRGRAIGADDMHAAMAVFKKNNINAVRTCHYPDQSLWYDLCDRNGIYMIDETNLESHGSWQKLGAVEPSWNVPGSLPEWKDCVVNRARSMFERDKNHAAVLIWSCGNESYGGKTLWEMSQYFRTADPSRLVHYEGIFWDRSYPDTSDMESQMYTPVERVRAFLAQHRDKPFIMCEYSHAMGDSCGGLTDYTEYAYQEPLYQGGFIWEYMDHGILLPGTEDRPAYAYGGDFGDRPTDREFCIDGLVLPHRHNTPKMDEVKAAYAPLKIFFTKNAVTVENRALFTDLAAYDLVLTAEVNGQRIRQAVLRADCAPGSRVSLELPFGLPEEGLSCLTLSARLRQAKPGLAAGYEAAFGQTWRQTPQARLTLPRPQCVEADCNIGVRGKDFEYLFARGKGLVSIRYGGVQLLDDTVRLNFWRAPTNNDEGCAAPFRFAFWKTAGLYAQCDALTCTQQEHTVTVGAVYTLPDGRTLPVDFCIDGAGRCEATLTWQGAEAELPELGLLFPLRAELRQADYLGLGPRETASDRAAGGRMGRWSYDVRQDFADFTPLYPQECGTRTQVYTARLTGSVPGIRFDSETGMVFSALPYTPHELENARRLEQLPRDDSKTVVRCAAFQRGVGGDNSWGAPPHPDACYAAAPGMTFRFGFAPADEN